MQSDVRLYVAETGTDHGVIAIGEQTSVNASAGFTIAQLLRSGWYSRVHVKSVESHYIRALLTSRKVMQRKCIDLENEIRGLLKVFGVKLPMRLRGGAFDAAVGDTIESDPALSHALLPMLQARQMLLETFLELDRRVRRAAHQRLRHYAVHECSRCRIRDGFELQGGS